jgi:hypothetical protein
MLSSQNPPDGVKVLRDALSEVDPKALAKALEEVTRESKRETPQLGEPVVPPDDAQLH